MPDLKIQEASQLLKKILANPKQYDLKISDGKISGADEKISFRFYKVGDKGVFEVDIDDLTFINKTGEWNNAMIMLENTIKNIEKESENQKITNAINKLKNYLSE